MKFGHSYFDHHIDDSEREKSYCFLSFEILLFFWTWMEKEKREEQWF